MMVGYWNDPAATAEALRDCWMHTGDLVRQDEDGYCWFVGRKKEIIIRGGSNISPMEVQGRRRPPCRPPELRRRTAGQALWSDRHGLRGSGRRRVARPTTDELRRFVADRIAAYKVPERIMILKEMPLNPTGKVDRKKLHLMVGAENPG